MNKRIVFLDTVHPILFNRLKDAGMLCEWQTDMDRSSILNGRLADAHGLILRSRLTLDTPMLQAMPQLKWIARSGAGLENIDINAANDLQIDVINSPEGNADSVGEHVIGQLLMLLHKLHTGHRHVQQGGWDREGHRGSELGSKTVGIIGYGNMGSAFAQRLSGFGCRVLAHDIIKRGFDGEHGVEEAELSAIFEHCDVVSLHVPLTEITNKMVNTDWIQQFKSPAILINSSRGAVVETTAVVEGLDSGHLQGAILDVLEYEKNSLEGLSARPQALNTLSRDERVVLSPHVAGWSHESYFKLSNVLAEKIFAYAEKS
jgi:D-3-phosphoglycerate dehydrogenase